MDKLKVKRKPFVEPSLKEEASLEDVTLMSGGHGHGHGHGSDKKGKNGHNGHNNGPNKPHGPGGRHT